MDEGVRFSQREQPSAQRTTQMAERFWRHSERDLEAARRLLFPATWYAASFHAHQAAEKALKAAHWHLRAEEPPWTHDLMKCASRVADAAGGLPPEIGLAIAQLQPMLDESRYPSSDLDEPIPPDSIGENDAAMAIKLAEEVRTWVRSLLQRPPGRPQR